MKKAFLFFSFATLTFQASALPEYDPFEDAAGSDLAGQTNLTGHTWNVVGTVNTLGTKPVIAAGSLSYPGLPASTSNSVFLTSNGSAGQSARVPLGTSVTVGPLFYSFILKVSDLGTMGTTAANNFFAGLADTSTAQANALARCGARVVTKKNGTGYQIGIGKGTATAEYQFDATVRNVNDVIFVVVSHERVGTTSTNVSLWVNPNSATFGSNAPPAATTSIPSGSGAGDMNSSGPNALVLSCQPTTIPSVTIDDVRVGRTWALVTGGPEIGTQPASQTRNAGTAATFAPVVGGTVPLFYQWAKEGLPLSNGGNVFGATASSLTLSNLLQVDAGNYTLIVTNSYGAVTSSIAVLTIIDPAINTQPTNQTVPPGGIAVFSAAAGGTPTLTYQWFKDGVTPMVNGGNISGATSATLTISSIGPGDVGTYSLFVTNGLNNFIQSSNATLTITDPAINAQPQSRTNNFGTTATFEVAVLGTGPLSYQWHKVGFGDLSDGGNVVGSQSNLLALTGVSYLDAAAYYVTVTNSIGTADSSQAILTVRDPIIVTNPVSLVEAAGSNVTFTVLAAGSPTLTYQWQRSATNIFDGGAWSGTASDTLSVAAISSAEAGTYRVVVSGGSGMSVTSSNATLTVLSPVTITDQPVSQTVVSGTNVSLTVGATGTAPLSYQWRVGNVDIPGANLSVLSFPSIQTSDTGEYTVVVTNSINSVTSSPANLTVLSVPPAIVSQPNSRTIAPGTRAVFVVSATGSLPLIYQWRRNGLAISGASSSTYALTNVQSSNDAAYTVVVSNSLNVITSAPAVLTVTSNLPLSETNLVLVRIGDGAQTLALTGNSMYLDQFTKSGSYVNTITIAEQGLSALIATGPDLTGTTLTGTGLTRSPDKRHLVISGYHADVPFPSNLNAATGTAVPRGIGLIDASGNFTLALTDTTAFSGSHFRAAATDGAGNFWGAGSGQGTQYFGTNSAPLIVQTDFANTRMVDIFNGELYALSSASGNSGLIRFYGLPTSVVTVTNHLPGFSTANTTDFTFDPPGTTVYLTVGNTVQKWQFDGSIFTNAYTLNIGFLTRHIVGDYSGATPVLYLTTATGELMSIVDTDASATPTTVLSSGPNQLYKGIRFGPSNARPTISITRAGTDVILTWSGAFTLLSSTNVTGLWAPVSGATSPYTNATGSASRRFFSLGQP